MDWIKICREMYEIYQGVFGNNHMFLIFLACLIYLWITEPESRRRIVYPTLLLVLIVLNPVSYVYIWTKFLNYAFWRTFWMIPVIPVIAYTAVRILMRINEKTACAAAAIAIVLLFTQGAGDVYSYDETSFVQAENTFKLPQTVIAVADELLTLDEEPYAIVDPDLNVYMREYTSRIHMMHGRDSYGYIARMDRRRRIVLHLLQKDHPDLKKLHLYMKKQGYPYYVRRNDRDEVNGFTVNDFYDAGFEVASEVGNYTIYYIGDKAAGKERQGE